MVVTGTAGRALPLGADHDRSAAGAHGGRATPTATRWSGVGAGSAGRRRATSRAPLAKGLIAAGIGHGDHIALWMPNQIEWVELWFAAAYIGAVLVTVNTRYKTEEVRYILGQSDARLLIMVREFVGIDYVEMLVAAVPVARQRAGSQRG